ncbi:unnamed protein product, partial [Adineta steineri]
LAVGCLFRQSQHCFVFFGAAIHYYAIYTYLLVPTIPSNEFYSKR